MRKPKNDETTPQSKEAYEQSYGDAQAGGWAPRRRIEDLDERSRYSSQRDRQEDRSGFRRGWQGQEESTERHLWGRRHARGDEDDAGPDEKTAPEPADTDAAAWVERRRKATRRIATHRKAARRKAARKKATRGKATRRKAARKKATRGKATRRKATRKRATAKARRPRRKAAAKRKK